VASSFADVLCELAADFFFFFFRFGASSAALLLRFTSGGAAAASGWNVYQNTDLKKQQNSLTHLLQCRPDA